MRNTLVIGTGFLGKVVISKLAKQPGLLAHTYNTERYFPDSVQLNLFQKSPAEVISLEDFDTIIFCSSLENSADAHAVQDAMSKAFTDCAIKRVIYISSDAVFDGKKGNYLETDFASPVTAYGENKKRCEELVAAIVPNSCVIRPSYIYGYSLGILKGRLAEARDAIQEGQQIRKFVDMFKSPIEVNRLAEIVLAVAASDYQGILHAGGERMSVYDFFKRSFEVLKVDTSLLLPDHMPQNPPAEYLKDTSLNSVHLQKAFGFKLLSVEKSLVRYASDVDRSELK